MIILYGLTFNGRHSSEFGLVMFSRNRPILPEPKLVAEDIPGMDGEYDFSVDDGETITETKRYAAITQSAQNAFDEVLSKIAVSSFK